MADMMAIVSKAVFEKAAGKSPAVGTRLRMDRYVSANKTLERLSGGGKLYLVTVRPPDEALWLVAVLEEPTFDGTQWIAKPCETPITDISSLKDSLQFESGKGLSATKGALGMSLQTPRAVTVVDAALLDGAVGLVAAPPPEREYPQAPPGAIATGAGNRRELLLSAVVADPENHDARQVYADALVSANDPRGEFIQLDTALSGPLSIRKREMMKRQRDSLYEANRKTWWPYKGLRLRVHDGFVIAAAGTLKALNGASQLFATEPVTEIEVRGLDGVEGVELLLRAKWLSRARRLLLRGKIKDDGFVALIKSPALANLRALNVTGNKLTAEGIGKLADHLPNVRALVLSNNKIGGGGIVGLLKWRQIEKLETLYLGNCGLDAAAVGKLFEGPPLAALTKLALAENDLGNGVGAQIERGAAKLPALLHLDLLRTGIQTAGAKQLIAANLPTVKRFDLRRNRVDAKLAQEDPRISA